jgi:hypothetical protein
MFMEPFEPFAPFTLNLHSLAGQFDTSLADTYFVSLSSFDRFEIAAPRRVNRHASGLH